ncbi:hypothetical protein J5Y03_16590 [Bacillus sp. RG28]|uniref:Replication protein n=1 Tax=Gottfriedia endophytica TaxID=2820819 RepID=A0A940NXE1_9BACI|nr:hypothetical protein [Gottfriedia endophytica]MBP0726778.1 hypothetical protein [Gottfriedia endophytica]
MQGWIKIHRKIKGHWLYEEKRVYSRFEAWFDLLLDVNHKDHKFLLGNELVEVKAGQTITSIRKLSDKWGWSNSKVTNFLKLLQNDGMIVLESDTKKTSITIINYEVYQSSASSRTTHFNHTDDEDNAQKHTNKNEKNLKNEENEKKNSYSDQFEQFWNEYPRKIEKKKAFKSFKIAIKNHSFETIMAGTKKYAKEVHGKDKQYIKHPSTFLNNESFIDGFEIGGGSNGTYQNTKSYAEQYGLDF